MDKYPAINIGMIMKFEKELSQLEEEFGKGARRSFSDLLESELEKAQVVLVTKGVLDQLQDVLEKISRIHSNDVIPLLDEIQTQYGKEAALSFRQVVVAALDDATTSVMNSREAIRNEVIKLEQELEGTADGSDMEMDGPEPDHDLDDFGGGEDAPMENGPVPDEDGGDFDLADDILAGDDTPVGRQRKEPAAESVKKFSKKTPLRS